MRMTLPLVVCVSLFCLTTAPAAEPEKELKSLREEVLQATTPGGKAGRYRALFEKVGKAGLPDLAKDEDPGLAIQAAWELHKKVVKRTKEIDDRVDDVYDPDELKKFVAVLKKHSKAPVPDWWAKSVIDVDVFVGRHHAFAKPDGPKMIKSKAGAAVPEGAELEETKEGLAFTVGKRTLAFPKDTFDTRLSFIIGVVGEKRSAVAVPSSISGFDFEIAGFDNKGGKPTWKSGVWSSGRDVLAGHGFHEVEMTEKDGVVCVFGGESHGMYAEAFDLATGKCLFRFCTCYWFNFSEPWAVK